MYDYVPILWLESSEAGPTVPDQVVADLQAMAVHYQNPKISEIFGGADNMEHLDKNTIVIPPNPMEMAKKVTSTMMPNAHEISQGMVEELLIKNSLKILPDIATSLREVVDFQLNRINVNISTAQPITNKQATAIETKVKGMVSEGSQLNFMRSIKPSILGGIELQIDNEIIDLSAARAIISVKEVSLA